MTRFPLRRSHARRATAAVLVAVTAGALPACSEDDPGPSAGDESPDVRGSEDLDDVYNGPYSADFREDLPGYEGQEITLEGTVEEVVSPVAFTLGSAEGEEDAEPLLVVLDGVPDTPDAGEDVVVAGIPQQDFDAVEVGAEVDLGDEATYEEWEEDPYLRASIIEPAPAGG